MPAPHQVRDKLRQESRIIWNHWIPAPRSGRGQALREWR